MEASSEPTSKLPDGVSEADLVDGPVVAHFPSGRATFQAPPPADAAGLVKPIPRAPPPQQPPQPPPGQVASSDLQQLQYLNLLTVVLDVLAARLHALLALIAACLLWGAVMVWPDQMRIIAAGIFSGLVFLPTVWTWWWAGLKGEK